MNARHTLLPYQVRHVGVAAGDGAVSPLGQPVSSRGQRTGVQVYADNQGGRDRRFEDRQGVAAFAGGAVDVGPAGDRRQVFNYLPQQDRQMIGSDLASRRGHGTIIGRHRMGGLTALRPSGRSSHQR